MTTGGNVGPDLSAKMASVSSSLPVVDTDSSSGGSDAEQLAKWRKEGTFEGSVVKFVDQTNDVQTDVLPTPITLPVEGVVKDDILAFLRRPVKIYEFSWDISNAAFNMDPWGLYYAVVTVQRKIANFYKITPGGLRIRVVTNGTPYLYGRYFISYCPYFIQDAYFNTTAQASATRISNCPNFHTIDPSANTVVEFDLPEVKQFDQLITAASNNWGSIVGCSGAGLQNAASAGNTQYCDMTFYASCINPNVEFNTTVNAYYGTSQELKGKLSAPLTKISKFSASLSKIPVIGQYATGISEAASLGASLASSFGFSKPIVNEAPLRVVPRIMGNMTNSDGPDNSINFTLQTNAMTTIDPTILGLPPGDEMAIASIVERPALSLALSWNDTQAIGTNLANFKVGPNTCCLGATYPMAPTNMCFASLPFTYWRGAIKYKFVFCVSKFHTGRIQIVWNPEGSNASTSPDPTNISLNWVVDLAQSSEVEIEIPYASKYPMLTTGNISNTWGSVGAYNNMGSNGTISIFVINKLRAGSVATTVTYLVFENAGKDYELFQPSLAGARNATTMVTFQPSQTLGSAPTNAGYLYYGTSQQVEQLDMPVLSHTIASERILSLRELGKRYMLDSLSLGNTGTPGNLNYRCYRDFPLAPGIVVNGTGAGAAQPLYNDVPFNFFNFWGPCYVGFRGAIRTKFVNLSADAKFPYFVRRCPDNQVGRYMSGNSLNYSAAGVGRLLGDWGPGVDVNANVTTASTTYTFTTSTEVTNPWVSQNYFELVANYCNTYGLGNGIMLITFNPIVSILPDTAILKATADDFSFVYFKGAPMLFSISIT